MLYKKLFISIFAVLGIISFSLFAGYLLNAPYVSKAASGVVNYTSKIIVSIGGKSAEFNENGASKLGGLTASDIMAQSGGGLLVTWGQCGLPQTLGNICAPGQSAPLCPSGYTQAYAGFGPFMMGTYGGGATICNQSQSGLVGGGTACNIASGYTTPCNTCRVCVK